MTQKPKIGTAKDAEAYATGQLGFKAADLSGLDAETAAHVVDTIEAIQTRFPELKGAVGEIVKTKQRNAYAAMETSAQVGTDGNPTSMKLHIGSMYDSSSGGLSKVKESYEKDVQAGFHPVGTDYSSVIWHEYGHALANLRSGRTAASKYTDSNDSYWRMSTYVNDRRKHLTEKEWVRTAAKSMKTTQKAFKEKISRYAAKNEAETFAEAFAEFTTSANPRPECIALMKAAGIVQ